MPAPDSSNRGTEGDGAGRTEGHGGPEGLPAAWSPRAAGRFGIRVRVGALRDRWGASGAVLGVYSLGVRGWRVWVARMLRRVRASITMRRSVQETVRSVRSLRSLNCRIYSSSSRHETVVVRWRLGGR